MLSSDYPNYYWQYIAPQAKNGKFIGHCMKMVSIIVATAAKLASSH